MAEEQPQLKVFKMILKKPWNFFSHTGGGTDEVFKGPGEFRVIKRGQRLVFADEPETGIDEAYARCWAGDYCKEHQITIIDPEEEKAKKEAGEKARKEAEDKIHKEQETAKREGVVEKKEEIPK